MSVKRYDDPDAFMEESPDGGYVEYSDYESLQAEWKDWASSLRYAAPEMQAHWWANMPGGEGNEPKPTAPAFTCPECGGHEYHTDMASRGTKASCDSCRWSGPYAEHVHND